MVIVATRRRWRCLAPLVGAAGFVMAVALAGCTGVANPPDGSGSAPSSVAVPTPSGGDSRPSLRRTIDSPIELPYASYYQAARAVLVASYERQEEVWRSWNDGSEALIAACMKQEGFEYFPVEYSPTTAEEIAERVYPQGDTLDIPWLPQSLTEVDSSGYGVASVAVYTGADEFADPVDDQNSEYFASLSGSAQQAYELALTGRSGSGELVNPSNCSDRADQEFPAPQAEDLSFLDTLDQMDSVMGGGQYTVDVTSGEWVVEKQAEEWELWGSPDYKQLLADYTGCLQEIDDTGAVDRWLGGQDANIGPTEMLALAVATAADCSVAVSGGLVGDDTPEEQRSLVGSQAERDVAVLDFKCRQETDFVNRYAQAISSVQARYIAEHRDAVDQLDADIREYLGRG